VADSAAAAAIANSATAPSPIINDNPAAPAAGATTGNAILAAASAVPGPVGDASKKVDQATSELERKKSEIQRTKGQIKSLWDTIAPKKK
jgi:hypothetical protein